MDLSSRCLKLPPIKKISIDNVESFDPKVKDFLISVVSSKLESFHFSGTGYYIETEFVPADTEYYLEAFKKVCKGTSQEIYFWNCSFTDSSLCSIIKASCNVNTLDFCSCKFSLLGPLSLAGPSYNIKELSFNYSGNTHSNDWSTYPERLNLLIKAISECSLKNSLEKISMASCGVKKEEIERMLKMYGINAQVFSD